MGARTSTVPQVESAERALDVAALVEQALSNVETTEFSWPEEDAERGLPAPHDATIDA